MRVISGSAKGTRLKSVPGETTRPILDRVKENLFNILGTLVPGTRWLDLFAGTGQVGIEALSRGAAECVFTDNARQAIRTIEQNLQTARLAEDAVVLQTDAFAYLQRLKTSEQPFDVIYIAPPQYKGLWVEALRLIDADPAACLYEEGLAIVQIDPSEREELELAHLALVDERKYGRTLFLFYEF
ncbi:MAG: 16S rRNA (guanine(966)-N(2))-methyltransferase RsmD, partial [Anaerolineales bacterium]|nr:16S rRNA (guanine(966)-N(2))-methyltransferase RsmD [Anaerolineales bacterium]